MDFVLISNLRPWKQHFPHRLDVFHIYTMRHIKKKTLKPCKLIEVTVCNVFNIRSRATAEDFLLFEGGKTRGITQRCKDKQSHSVWKKKKKKLQRPYCCLQAVLFSSCISRLKTVIKTKKHIQFNNRNSKCWERRFSASPQHKSVSEKNQNNKWVVLHELWIVLLHYEKNWLSTENLSSRLV